MSNFSDESNLIWSIAAARDQGQTVMRFSHSEVKESVEDGVVSEFEEAQDNQLIEEGIATFIEWLRSGKLQVRAYPTQRIHAKLYIMTFPSPISPAEVRLLLEKRSFGRMISVCTQS